MTHAKQLKAQFSYNRKQVMWLTGMNEAEYINFQVDTAKAWVDRYWADIIDADSLFACAMFWSWWHFAWDQADDTMIITPLFSIKKQERHTSYRAMHQYIFNESSQEVQWLIADFRNMRSEFEKDIKKQKEVKK